MTASLQHAKSSQLKDGQVTGFFDSGFSIAVPSAHCSFFPGMPKSLRIPILFLLFLAL
jgi:hypothetical protein